MIHRSFLLLVALVIIVVTRPAIAQIDRGKIVETLRRDFEKNPKILQLLDRKPDVQRRFEKWLNALAQERLDAQTAEAPSNPLLRKELLDRMKQDQEARKRGVVREWAKVDKENRIRLRKVLNQFGWPGKSLVGKDGAYAAWILAQHADHDRRFQKRCLKLMQAAPKGEVSLRNLAYLEDRVRSGTGKRQLYGTQLMKVDGKMTLKPVEDPANLNQRREESAMMPIEVYLLFANGNN